MVLILSRREVGLLSVWASQELALYLERVGVAIPSVLILTTFGLALAQVPAVSRLEGARLMGMFAVYVFLAVIGAFCDVGALSGIGQLGVTLLLFVTITVLVHGVVTFTFGALLRIDPDVVAVASQANLGGGTSALALARSLGRADLTVPAILAGSLGYALGTYLGFVAAGYLR